MSIVTQQKVAPYQWHEPLANIRFLTQDDKPFHDHLVEVVDAQYEGNPLLKRFQVDKNGWRYSSPLTAILISQELRRAENNPGWDAATPDDFMNIMGKNNLSWENIYSDAAAITVFSLYDSYRPNQQLIDKAIGPFFKSRDIEPTPEKPYRIQSNISLQHDPSINIYGVIPILGENTQIVPADELTKKQTPWRTNVYVRGEGLSRWYVSWYRVISANTRDLDNALGNGRAVIVRPEGSSQK